jgi:GNAT superfamily N-acetyltransferase
MDGRVGYIMNLYTDPAHRRQGLARRIFEQIMGWIRAQGIPMAALHFTEEGRQLYARFGFVESNEMRAKV